MGFRMLFYVTVAMPFAAGLASAELRLSEPEMDTITAGLVSRAVRLDRLPRLRCDNQCLDKPERRYHHDRQQRRHHHDRQQRRHHHDRQHWNGRGRRQWGRLRERGRGR